MLPLEKVEKWLFSQIEAAGCVDWRPALKMNGFPIGFFRPKIGGRDHAAFVGARRARTRREITHSSRSLLKFPSVSEIHIIVRDGNKISHHCQIKRGSSLICWNKFTFIMPAWEWNHCGPWNIKRYWVLVVEKPIESLLEKQLSKSLKGSSTLQAVESL